MRDYPRDWDRIARGVKDAAGWRCENPSCRHRHEPKGGYSLTVHHKDGNPANCHPDNMAALCQRCHLKAQARLRLYGPEDERQLRFRFYAPGEDA